MDKKAINLICAFERGDDADVLACAQDLMAHVGVYGANIQGRHLIAILNIIEQYAGKSLEAAASC